LIGTEFPELVNNKLVSDILGNVKRRTYTDRELFNNRHVINVKNGLLDLDTLQLQPHTPDYLSTAQLDVFYNPDAKAPKITKFFKEVAQSGDVALIEEIIGWLLWPDYHIHKAIMLVGPGRNGKGTLLRLITAFMGRKSISNVTLQDLVSDTFAKSDLYGKLANIGGDLPSKDLSDTSAFRNLTGGDDNRAQEKYRPAFSFRNKAKMLFSANVLPRSQDDTYAFYVRWILIEFLNRFVLDDGTADPDLDEKLQTPEEMSGLLNIALEGLKRLKANGWKFSYTKTAEDVEVMYKRNANPVFAFLMDECEAGCATDYIEKSVFFDKFNSYVKAHSLRPMSTTKFGELLKDQTEIPVSNFRPWVERGDRPHCWAGVKFKTPLTKKEETGEKPGNSPEEGEKSGNETASGGPQSIPSILKPYSTNPEEKNEKEKEKINERIVEYKQTTDGMDCDPLIAVSSEESEEGKLRKKLTGDDPGFQKFKAGMKKRHCLMCGEHFSYDLGIQWQDGYICARCHREGPPPAPVKPDSQTTLGKDEAKA
jgi:P4 family phage/plasmid primase-like protien